MLLLTQSWALGGRGLCLALGTRILKFLEQRYCQIPHFVWIWGRIRPRCNFKPPVLFYFENGLLLLYFILESVVEGLERETPGIYMTSGLWGT